MTLSLDSLFSDDRVEDSDRKVNIYDFETVHPTDWEPVTIIEPDIDHGPWIAGGACLRWFQGHPVGNSDIDVFCRSPKQAKDVIDRIKSYQRYQVKHNSENAVTIEHRNKSMWEDHDTWTIQVIVRRFFNSLDEVIDNFDITVCQVGTGGTEWVLGKHTARDIREKNLRFAKLQPDAPKRLTKYMTYGYRPVEGTFEQICSSSDTRWKYIPGEDYENAL